MPGLRCPWPPLNPDVRRCARRGKAPLAKNALDNDALRRCVKPKRKDVTLLTRITRIARESKEVLHLCSKVRTQPCQYTWLNVGAMRCYPHFCANSQVHNLTSCARVRHHYCCCRPRARHHGPAYCDLSPFTESARDRCECNQEKGLDL